MIRFSAGLVVVAIGVLIGGVATSKLSLVYVAIAVSAVALVALAIGVALKRDELFEGGPGLAPAGADTGSGMPVGQSADVGDVRGSAGDVRGDRQQIRPKVPGPATAAFEAAAAASAASAPVMAPTVAAPSVTAPPVPEPAVGSPVGSRAVDNPPLGQRRSAFGQTPAREADSATDWQTRSPRPPRSSGDQVRSVPTWTPKDPATSKGPAAKEPQSAATPAVPRVWRSPDQPSAPSWFDRLNQPAADPTARADAELGKTESAKTEPSNAVASGSGWSWSDRGATPAGDGASTAAQAAVGASDVVDDDDDWPTRYSWLEDDDTDEAASESAGADKAAEPAEVVDEVAEVDAAPPKSAGVESPPTVASATVKSATAQPATAQPATAQPATAQPATAQPATAQPGGIKLVTVIPGVPRYHEPDCILIRFMDSEDVARKSVAEAQADNCTPCAACQPEA